MAKDVSQPGSPVRGLLLNPDASAPRRRSRGAFVPWMVGWSWWWCLTTRPSE